MLGQSRCPSLMCTQIKLLLMGIIHFQPLFCLKGRSLVENFSNGHQKVTEDKEVCAYALQ